MQTFFLASLPGKTAQKVCTDDLETLRKPMKTKCFPTPSVGEDCGGKFVAWIGWFWDGLGRTWAGGRFELVQAGFGLVSGGGGRLVDKWVVRGPR